MKRYDLIGEHYDLLETKEGAMILFDDFEEKVSSRIKELKAIKFNLSSKDGVYEFNLNSAIINELKQLIK